MDNQPTSGVRPPTEKILLDEYESQNDYGWLLEQRFVATLRAVESFLATQVEKAGPSTSQDTGPKELTGLSEAEVLLSSVRDAINWREIVEIVYNSDERYAEWVRLGTPGPPSDLTPAGPRFGAWLREKAAEECA